MILPIYIFGQPVLRKVAEDITPDYPQLKDLIGDMWADAADALVADGVQAAAHYDPALMASTAAKMALNTLDHQFPGIGTDLSSDEAGRFILPYGLSE